MRSRCSFPSGLGQAMALVMACTLAGQAEAAEPAQPSLCASPAQAALVAPLYTADPTPPPFLASGKLGLPESIVVSALPPAKAIGVPGTEFRKVWDSLQTWDQALTLVLKGGSVFEIHGRIPPGEPSTRSQFFNLKGAEAGLGGHLRPDLIGAIYAINLVGQEGPMRGVTFVDQKGEGIFGVYLPESRDPAPGLVAQFDRTWALLASLPRACPAPAAP